MALRACGLLPRLPRHPCRVVTNPQRRLFQITAHEAERSASSGGGMEEAVWWFGEKGYLVVKGVLDEHEVGLVRTAMERSEYLQDFEMSVDSGSDALPGKQTIWNLPGDGTLGALTRSARVCGVAGKLLGGEVHHYFNKMLQKKAGDLGCWQWHQDYGSYWYYDYFLRPDMLTAWVAVDPSTRANGCLKVIPGSNKIGRIDCIVTGNQRVVDPKRVEHAIVQHGVEHVELEPGDAVFFHGNTLHSSEGNPSTQRRMAFATHFTRDDNLQFVDPSVTGLNLYTRPMQPRRHAELREMGVVVDTADVLGLQEPEQGAKLTSKRDVNERDSAISEQA